MPKLTIVLSDELNLALRTHLGARGSKKGDISKFIEEAVRLQLNRESSQSIPSPAANVSTRASHETAHSGPRSRWEAG